MSALLLSLGAASATTTTSSEQSLGFFGLDPWWLIIIKAVAIFVMLVLLTLFNIWAERRVVARMQQRIGPDEREGTHAAPPVAAAIRTVEPWSAASTRRTGAPAEFVGSQTTPSGRSSTTSGSVIVPRSVLTVSEVVAPTL